MLEVEEKKTARWDKKIGIMLSACMVSNISYIMIAPFLPIKFKEKGVDVDVMGFIFAAYPISSILFSIIIGKFPGMESGKVICGGLFFMGLAFVGFGLLHFVNSAVHISWMAIVLRFI